LKVSANVKIAIQYFENFGGGTNAPLVARLMPSTIHSGIMLYTRTLTLTLINRLKPWCCRSLVCYARVWRNNRFYDKSNVARSCGRCYHNSTRSLLIVTVSTLALRVKATESFLELVSAF